MEDYDENEWIVFDQIFIMRDYQTGGLRTFLNSEIAQEYRKIIYETFGISFISFEYLISTVPQNIIIKV